MELEVFDVDNQNKISNVQEEELNIISKEDNINQDYTIPEIKSHKSKTSKEKLELKVTNNNNGKKKFKRYVFKRKLK